MATNENTRCLTPETKDAYARRRLEVARLMDVLEIELDKCDNWAAAEPENAVPAPLMDHLREGLIDLIEELSGIERKEIERFLSE